MEKIPVIVLQSSGRAGALLFGALLDGHSDVAMLPRTTYLNDAWDQLDHRDARSLGASLVKAFPYWFDGTALHRNDRFAQLGRDMDETYTLDGDRFIDLFEEAVGDAERDFTTVFLAVHLAHHRLAAEEGYRAPGDAHAIFLNVHGADTGDFERLDDAVVDKRMVFLSRDPAANLHSLYSFYRRGRRHHPLHRRAIESFRQIVMDDQDCRASVRERPYHTIMLDDLHRTPEATVRRFCAFADIAYEPRLLHPSVMGLPWWGNGVEPSEGLNRQWPLQSVDGSLSRTARVLAPLINARMIEHDLPRGAASLSASAWAVFGLADYERDLWRTSIEDRRAGGQSMLIAMDTLRLAAVYLQRIAFSFRFRMQYPKARLRAENAPVNAGAQSTHA